MEKGFAAAVGGQEWGGEEPAKGAHGQDQATTARYHSWNHKLTNSESGHVVDCDDIDDFLLWSLGKSDGDGVREADIVD